MAGIIRLTGEGIGPFEKFDFDFSDGNGHPHMGPHILAGVNGSGKSTILRTLAWLFETGTSQGFPAEDFYRLGRGGISRATAELDNGVLERLFHSRFGRAIPLPSYLPLAVGYGPSRAVKHLDRIDLFEHPSGPAENSLSFDATVQNDYVQSWLGGLVSRRALVERKGEDGSKYSAALARFDATLSQICGETMGFDVDIEPYLQARIVRGDQRLNFSQIPDGIRNTVGWLADLLMRLDMNGSDEAVVLLDEIDAHLHPKWQRLILIALRKALPKVQFFVTTHSPFVIGSCPGARVHILEVDEHGRAHNHPPQDAPVGESYLAIMKGIFDVGSRFDVETERELNEWNDLRRSQVAGRLTTEGAARLSELTGRLSERSEELRQIVDVPGSLSESLLRALHQ